MSSAALVTWAICAKSHRSAITKWSGIRHLASEYGISDAEILRGGRRRERPADDSRRRIGVAMENALPEVKAAADRIAPATTTMAWWKWLEWLLGVVW